MNEQVQKQGVGGGAETGKLVTAIVLVLAGVAAFYVLRTEGSLVRWGAVVGGVVLGTLVFAFSERGRSFRKFVLDARIELRKVFWPNRQETGTTTLAVFVFVIIGGVFFWVLDLALAWAAKWLTGQGG